MQVPLLRNLQVQKPPALTATQELRNLHAQRALGWPIFAHQGLVESSMKVTVTPIGAPSDGVGAAAGAYVDYLTENVELPVDPLDDAVGYYAGTRGGDVVEGVGEWGGQGAERLGLSGDVGPAQLSSLLQGRNPFTGERLTTARGSAGRKNLKVGSPTRLVGLERVWDLTDAEAALSVRDVIESLQSEIPPEYVVEHQRETFFSERALRWLDSHLADQRAVAAVVERHEFMDGDPEDWVTAKDVAAVAGVSPRYIGKLINADDSPFPAAELRRESTWWIKRSEAITFVGERKAPNVRVAFDCTSTVEKSVSVLGLVAADEEVRRTVARCVGDANRVAIEWLDQHASSGRSKSAAIGSEGLTVASFMHGTSRNDDPFLHVHNVVVNAIEDSAGGGRTLDATGLYSQSKAASAMATAHLRHQLTVELGVDWRRSAAGVWEVAGISDQVLRHFSSRTKEIEEALRELLEAGAAEPDEDRLKKATRRRKSGIHPDAARSRWQEEARDLGFSCEDLAAVTTGRGRDRVDRGALFGWLEQADGVCADGPTFTYGDVLSAIADWCPVGERLPVLSVNDLEILAHEWLSSSRVHQVIDTSSGVTSASGRSLGSQHRQTWTTETMRQLQADIRQDWTQGRNSQSGIADRSVIATAIAGAKILSSEQQALVWDWLQSGHRVQAAIGRPGTGKTTVMATAVQAWQGSGLTVLGAAVKGEAARILGNETGIETNTVASYLTRWAVTGQNPLDSSTVLIVDEASTLSDWDLHKLLVMAREASATLRLVGDPAQHGSVEAGGSWSAMTRELAAETPELMQQHRVTNSDEARAAELIRHGEIADAFAALAAGGTIEEHSSWSDAFAPLVSRWFEQRDSGRGHPIVERRNEIRSVLNTLVQQVRLHNGEIDDPVELGERSFGVGDQIIARSPNKLMHPVDDPEAWVRNGSAGVVSHIGDESLTVTFDDLGDIAIPRSWAGENLDLSYSVTSYAVQGATFDASTSAITAGASQSELLVNITRGRQQNAVMLVGTGDAELGSLSEHADKPLMAAIADSITGTGQQTLHELDPRAGQTATATIGHGRLHLAHIRHLQQSAPGAVVDRARVERLRDIRRQIHLAPPDSFVDYFGPRPSTPWLSERWLSCAAGVEAYREEWGYKTNNERPWCWLIARGTDPAQQAQWDSLTEALTALFVDTHRRQLAGQSVSLDQLRALAGRPKHDRRTAHVAPAMQDGTQREGADL